MERFRERMQEAMLVYRLRTKRPLDQRELGQLVSRELRGRRPITQPTVSRWFRGSEPPLATIRAIAKVLGVDPGWLAFGAASAARKPPELAVRALAALAQQGATRLMTSSARTRRRTSD